MVPAKSIVVYSCRGGQSFPQKLIGHQHKTHTVPVSIFNRNKLDTVIQNPETSSQQMGSQNYKDTEFYTDLIQAYLQLGFVKISINFP